MIAVRFSPSPSVTYAIGDATADVISSVPSGWGVDFLHAKRQRDGSFQALLVVPDSRTLCPFCGSYASRCNQDTDDGRTICAMTGREIPPHLHDPTPAPHGYAGGPNEMDNYREGYEE